MTPEEEELILRKAAQGAQLPQQESGGLLAKMDSGLESFGKSSIGKGLLAGGQFLGDTVLSAVSKPYAEDLMARNKMARDEETRVRSQAFNEGVLGQAPSMRPFDLLTQELTGVTEPQQFPGQGFLGGDMSKLEYLSQMQSSPNPIMQTAAAAAIRDQMSPTSQSDAVTFGQYEGFEPERRDTFDQFKGRNKGPQFVVENNINTAPELENMADKETYKITGKYRGDRLTQFNNVMRANTEVVDSINVTKDKLNSLFGITGDATTGYASLITKLQIPGMAATDWNEAKDVIVSRLAVDKMAELKALSATGSTGFGALSQKELETLQKQLGSLEQAQSPKAIKASITEIIKLLDKSEGKFRKARKDEIGWYNRNKLPNMETYTEENPYDSPTKLKPVSELTDAELLEELKSYDTY